MQLWNPLARFKKQPLQKEYATLGIDLTGRKAEDVTHAELDAARRTQLKELHAVRRGIPEEAMQAAVDERLREVNEAHARIKNPGQAVRKAAASGPIPMEEVKESVAQVVESGNNKVDIIFKKPEKTLFGSWRPTEGKRLLLADLREGSVLETAAKAGAKGKGGLAVAAATVATVGGLGVLAYNSEMNAEMKKGNWQDRVALNNALQARAI